MERLSLGPDSARNFSYSDYTGHKLGIDMNNCDAL